MFFFNVNAFWGRPVVISNLWKSNTKIVFIIKLCTNHASLVWLLDCLWGQRPIKKREATLFLCQKKTKWRTALPDGFACPIPYPIPQVRSSYSLKPVKSVFLIYTSQNNKPLHHTVSSPMNPIMGVLSSTKLGLITLSWASKNAERGRLRNYWKTTEFWSQVTIPHDEHLLNVVHK